ncbi:hypothetical protein BURPSS13_T0138 [Burkholderia pseudomallei S13]|nr:hypothetical protein BURPSS13_T0138 [Burkholderia pseudomallei S13]
MQNRHRIAAFAFAFALASPCFALLCRAVAVPRNCRAFRWLAGLPRVTGRSAAQRLSR